MYAPSEETFSHYLRIRRETERNRHSKPQYTAFSGKRCRKVNSGFGYQAVRRLYRSSYFMQAARCENANNLTLIMHWTYVITYTIHFIVWPWFNFNKSQCASSLMEHHYLDWSDNKTHGNSVMNKLQRVHFKHRNTGWIMHVRTLVPDGLSSKIETVHEVFRRRM